MNYLKVYCNLIRKADNRTPPDGYTEKHHIFPKSIFGKNNRIVVLTAREHYIAHALLERICIKRYGDENWKTIKMMYAFSFMNSKTNKNYYCNSYLYEGLRIRRSKIVSNMMKEYFKNNVSPSKGRKLSEEHRKKLILANTGRVPSAETRKKISDAKKGKIVHNEDTRKKIKEARSKQIFSKETHQKRAETLRRMKFIWMFDPISKKNYKIPKSEVDQKILEGLVVGFSPKITDETREKLKAAANKRWSSVKR